MADYNSAKCAYSALKVHSPSTRRGEDAIGYRVTNGMTRTYSHTGRTHSYGTHPWECMMSTLSARQYGLLSGNLVPRAKH